MPADLIRDSTFGLLLNFLSKGKLFPFPEERQGYVAPAKYTSRSLAETRSGSESTLVADAAIAAKRAIDGSKPKLPRQDSATTAHSLQGSIRNDHGQDAQAPLSIIETKEMQECRMRLGRTVSTGRVENGEAECEVARNEKIKTALAESGANTPARAHSPPPAAKTILIDWDGPDDPENPKNWSSRKRLFVTFLISLLTFGVYAGSAIYTPSIPGIMERFDTSLTVAVLGLTLFVFGYGVGPMILTPLQEFPKYGRTPVYIICLITFSLFQLPIIYAKNVTTIMVFRFLTGFIGSPALATGGATLIDIWPEEKVPYAIATWAIGAVCGPVLGPVIAGFPAMKMGWQWPILIMCWVASFVSIILFFFLPETFAPTILYRRAERLRKVTGNPNIRSQSEIDQANTKLGDIWYDALIMPFKLMIEPAVFVVSLYLGLVYAIFYLFFESFPLVYSEGGVYNWNLGVSQLPFVAFAVTGVFTFFGYVYYQKTRITSLYMSGKFVPEDRLEIGLLAAFSIPIVTLIFGWTARASVHWIVPVIFGALYLPGVFLCFQSILVYLPTAYYSHTGSVLAANDLFRSTFASVFPLFGHAFYKNLGLGPGSTLLAGLSALMIPLFWLIKRHGAALRARSKYAH